MAVAMNLRGRTLKTYPGSLLPQEWGGLPVLNLTLLLKCLKSLKFVTFHNVTQTWVSTVFLFPSNYFLQTTKKTTAFSPCCWLVSWHIPEPTTWTLGLLNGAIEPRLPAWEQLPGGHGLDCQLRACNFTLNLRSTQGSPPSAKGQQNSFLTRVLTS